MILLAFGLCDQFGMDHYKISQSHKVTLVNDIICLLLSEVYVPKLPHQMRWLLCCYCTHDFNAGRDVCLSLAIICLSLF
jgi:hypothetical protein